MSAQPTMYESFDDKQQPITLLLKGDSGTGKTWKAAHFPRPAIFNFDNNLSGLRKLDRSIRDKIKIVNPKQKNGKALDGHQVFDNFVSQLGQVCEDPNIDTIVVDSLTTLAEVLMDKVVGTSNPATAPQIQHFGNFTRYLKWLGDEFLANSELDKHVVFLAHEQVMKDELTQQTTRTLNISTKQKDSFGLYFSDCWRTYTRVPGIGKVQYMVRVLPGADFTAKCTLDLPPEFLWDDQVSNIMKQLGSK